MKKIIKYSCLTKYLHPISFFTLRIFLWKWKKLQVVFNTVYVTVSNRTSMALVPFNCTYLESREKKILWV